MYVFSNKVYLIFSSIEFRGKSYEDFMISVEKSSPLLLIWILISSVYWSGEFLKLFAKWAKHAIPSRTALSLDHAHSCASIHNILRFVLFFVHNYKYREHLGEKTFWKTYLETLLNSLIMVFQKKIVTVELFKSNCILYIKLCKMLNQSKDNMIFIIQRLEFEKPKSRCCLGAFTDGWLVGYRVFSFLL